MAYKSQKLSVIAYANGFTLWHYTTIDKSDILDNRGYFNEAANLLRVGDMILANTDTAGAFVSGMFAVKSNKDGVVDLSNLTSVGAINSD